MIRKLEIKLQDELNGTYQGFVNEKNQKDVFGVFLWDSGDFYLGEWKDNRMNGQGIIYFSSGGYLEGYFTDSVVNNRALLVFPNNDKYFACWKRGNLDGKVSMLFKANKKLFTTVYEEGQFRKIDSVKENVKEVKTVNEFIQKCDINKLIQKYQNVATQSGNNGSNMSQNNQDQENEEQLAFSKINFNDGGFFIGITKNNLPNGIGLFQYSDQKFDCGFYQNGFLNGNGRKNFPNGDFYDGQFSQGKFEGEGIIYHKTQNAYYYGIFKDNILIDEKQKEQGYPREILNQIKQRDHQNGNDFTGEVVPQDWIKLSLFHNLQFLGNTAKQDTFNILKSSSYQLQQQQQFISSANSSSRNKDNTQKYHQKNLDTVYYLNQKIRAAQTPSNNSTASKENTRSKEGATHRKNQASLDFIRTGIDSNFNSLQKIKSEYMTLPFQNGNNKSLLNQQQLNQQSSQPLIQQLQQVNSSQKLKSESKEEIQEDNLRYRKSNSQTRKQPSHLSPPARPSSTTQYNPLVSPQSVSTKNTRMLNSPLEKNIKKLDNIMGNLNTKNLQSKPNLKKELSPQPKLIGTQSPIEKVQKAVNQRLNEMKKRTNNQVINLQQNANNKSKGSIKQQTISSTLATQKTSQHLNRVTSPDSTTNHRLNELKNFEVIQPEVLPNQGDALYRASKTPLNQIEDSIDQGSIKEISADISRLKCDSLGDLLRENNNRSSQLTQPSIQKPKSSISTTNTLNKQKSHESKAFVQGFNQVLNNTPQRQSHKSTSSNNQDKTKKSTTTATPFQTEEAMKHYYQTRIRKQAPEEIQIKDDTIKNKQSAVLSTKSCSTNRANQFSTQSNQKTMTQTVGNQQIKNKKDVFGYQNKLKQVQQNYHSSSQNKLLSDKNSQLKATKGLISVKSQDNLINDQGCSFSSLQEQQQQQTQPDEYQKSKFSKINEQYQIQVGITCFTQDDLESHNEELENLQDDNEDEEFNVNNENENCLNQQNQYYRNSDCLPSNAPSKFEDIGQEHISLKKGLSAENDISNNENVQNNNNSNIINNQQESKNLRNTISDQIKHILSMQKHQNISKHKFTMKPFILQGTTSKKTLLVNDNTQSENQSSSLKTYSQIKNEEKSLKMLAVQNPLHIITSFQQKSKKDENKQQKEDQSISPLEIPSSKGERHVLTPFHPTKTQQQKGAQSSNSYQSNKSQGNESIRSINQKMSSYISFQERLNAIGQCIYKKDWNATQSLNSIRSLSRNSSTLVEKNQISDDNINIMNHFSSENINLKEDKQSQNIILPQQQIQQQLQLQNQNVNQLVVNYLQAQNNISESNNQGSTQVSDNIKVKDPIHIIQSDCNFDSNAEDKIDLSADNKIKQELLFDEIVQSNYNSILQEEKTTQSQFENNTLLHSSRQQNIQEILRFNLCQQEIEQMASNNNIEGQGKEENMNFGILKTEEGEGDSLNKNDLACLQLKGFNESDYLNNNERSDGSCNLNELQIDQKHFNEEDLLGINALEEILSQNSESLCSFSPPKQDFNSNNKNHTQLISSFNNQFLLNNQQQQQAQRELEDDLEFQNIFDCQLNLESLDLFTLSQQPLNENSIRKNNSDLLRPNVIDDIAELSPIKTKETNFDDLFQQQQMITEFHFYEDFLLQQKAPNENIGGKQNYPFEDNCRYNQKYRPVLEIIKENASEDQYTSPKKKQRSQNRQIFPQKEDLEVIVTQIQF